MKVLVVEDNRKLASFLVRALQEEGYVVDVVDDCCVQSMYQDKSGNMWWGSGQGLYRFDGDQYYQVKKNGPW